VRILDQDGNQDIGHVELGKFLIMDYIISEDRLVKLVDKYITSVVGELIETKSSHHLGDEKDFDIVDENGNMVFQYFGKHLGVSKDLFSNIHGLFSHINVSETEKLIQLWFEKKYPDEPVQAVYYSIYF
jgi:hypothetical protein